MIKFAEKKIYSFLSTNNRSDPFPILCALARSEEDWRGNGKEREGRGKKKESGLIRGSCLSTTGRSSRNPADV